MIPKIELDKDRTLEELDPIVEGGSLDLEYTGQEFIGPMYSAQCGRCGARWHSVSNNDPCPFCS